MPTHDEINAAYAYQEAQAAMYPEMRLKGISSPDRAVPTPNPVPVLENLLNEMASLWHSFNSHVHAMNEMHRRLTGSSALPPEQTETKPGGELRTKTPHFEFLHEAIERYRSTNNQMHTLTEELRKLI